MIAPETRRYQFDNQVSVPPSVLLKNPCGGTPSLISLVISLTLTDLAKLEICL